MTKTNGDILPFESVLEICLFILEEYPGLYGRKSDP